MNHNSSSAAAGQPEAREIPPRTFALAVLGVTLLGAVVRLGGLAGVFTPDGVELVPSDTHYWIRFARLQVESFPRPVTSDPFVGFPDGARITWSPLHAWLVAPFTHAFGEGGAEAGAALAAPGIAVAGLLLLAALAARCVGRRAALVLTALVALVPAAVEVGAVGTADHHVHEPVFAAAVAILFGRALATGSVRIGLASGLALGFARLLAPSGFALVPPLALAALIAVVRVGSDAARPALAAASGSVVTLALGVVTIGFPDSLEYELLSWFQPLLVASCLAGAIGLGRLVRGEGIGAVWLAVSAAGFVPLAPQLLQAAGHLARADRVLQAVDESQPLLTDPTWAVSLLGVLLVLAPVAAYLAIRSPTRSSSWLSLPSLALTLAFAAAAAIQARFAPALAGAASALVATTWPRFEEWLSRRSVARRALIAVVTISVLALGVVPPSPDPTKEVAYLRPLLTWIRDSTEFKDDGPPWGIGARWRYGHFVTLWAERPALATPFSQAPWHVAANERADSLFAMRDEEEAIRFAQSMRLRYLLVTPPRPGLDEGTIAERLWRGQGTAATQSTTRHFRLARVTDALVDDGAAGKRPYAALYEVVP